MLLNLFHLKPIRGPLDYGQLQELAELVDKYKCSDACTIQATAWMLHQLENMGGFTYFLPHFVALAIVFKSDEVFEIAMVGMALTSTCGNSDEDHEDGVEYRIESCELAHLIPDNVIGECASLEFGQETPEADLLPGEIKNTLRIFQQYQLCPHGPSEARIDFKQPSC